MLMDDLARSAQETHAMRMERKARRACADQATTSASTSTSHHHPKVYLCCSGYLNTTNCSVPHSCRSVTASFPFLSFPFLIFSSLLISSHLISSHLISSHLISSHLLSSPLISSHLLSSPLFSSPLLSSPLLSSPLIFSYRYYWKRFLKDHICNLMVYGLLFVYIWLKRGGMISKGGRGEQKRLTVKRGYGRGEGEVKWEARDAREREQSLL